MPLLGALVVVLVAAKLGGALFERLRLPAVLGELLGGVVLGNLGLLGVHAADYFRADAGLNHLGQLGALILLFGVGLESKIEAMARVGVSSLGVAVLGVIAPLLLGFGVAAWFFPSESALAHWFVGGILTATSVGITARVLSDLRQTASLEGQIILGAAVIDDVLGLLVLAVIAGIIRASNSGTAFSAISVGLIVGKCVAFWGAAIFAGRWASRLVFRWAARLPGEGTLLSSALVLCFALAWVAAKAGLAPIVGAFAAGLIVEEVHYTELREREPRDRSVEDLVRPLLTFLAPLFFVLMGMRVDLTVFGHWDILAFGAVLTVAALAGKQLCALGVLRSGADPWAVGLGMMPRGEVGLIFAGLGATLVLEGRPVVSPAIFSAVVIVVTVTTLVTPPALVARFRRLPARHS